MCPQSVTYGVCIGCGGGSSSTFSLASGGLEDEGYVESEVSALSGSERLRFVDASSKQIAHWSKESDQNLPLRVLVISFAAEDGSIPVSDRMGPGRSEESVICDHTRDIRLDTARVLMRGRRKSKNSCQPDQ